MIPEEYKGDVMAALANIESAFDGDEEFKFVAKNVEFEFVAKNVEFNFIKLGAQVMAEQLIDGLKGEEVRNHIMAGLVRGVLNNMFETLRDYRERESRGEL